jgi:ABC-type molybdate transport system substrate-binding protein
VHGFVACGFQSQTYSDELKIFTSRAVATVLEKIGPEFEKNTGHTLNIDRPELGVCWTHHCREGF